MKSFGGAAAVLCAALCGRAGAVAVDALARAHARVNPVGRVVQLLGDLEAKVTKDGEAERKAYTEFQDWCQGGSKDKQFEIKTAKAGIEDLSATISKAVADISAAGSKIEELGAAVASGEADLKAATEIRQKENSEFLAVEKELMDVVDTLDRAVNILERKKGSALVQAKIDTQDVTKLVQMLNTVVDASALSLHDKTKLMALAQSVSTSGDADDAADAEIGAPAAEVYKQHGESIIDVLEDLREKAETQLGEARKQETSARHNYEMLKQSLEDQAAADTKELGEEKSTSASAAEVKAAAEGDLAVTKKGLADAESALALLQGSCMTAAADHAASQKSLSEELEALAAAKKAIAEMTAGAEGEVYGAAFLQVDGSSRRAAAALQAASRLSTRADLANFEVVNLVRRLAKKERSAALTQLAGRIAAVIKYGASAGEDPFAKVKDLITEMIDRLEKEAGSEASHKAYCDKEMATTQAKSEDLTATIDGLTAKVDKKKALSVKLLGEVKDLQGDLSELAQSQSELDKVRSEEKAAFVQTKADLQQGLEGVRVALKVLREYYASSEEPEPALAQQPSVPVYHSKSTGSGTSIIGMIEVIESDFGKNLAQAETDEDSAETEYQKVTQQNKVTTAMKQQDVKYKTKEAASLDKAVSELSSDSAAAQTELDAVLDYSKSIRGACVLKPETYEERKGRREAEVAGLKEALSILNGEAMLLQQGQTGHRGALRGKR